MGEHKRMKVWMEDGAVFYFMRVCGPNDEAIYYADIPNSERYTSDVKISSIHCVIGEPLAFKKSLCGHHADYKYDCKVKDIEYDIMPDGRPCA